MKFAVFGDTGGHVSPLIRSIIELNVDLCTFKIPKDLTIIHVGDLIHKGPQSSMVVAVVDCLMRENPGQWVQLMGNHELMHLNERPFFPCDCTNETKAILMNWWDAGLIHHSTSVDKIAPTNWTDSGRPLDQESVVKRMLFTHAGLTQGFHERLHLNNDLTMLTKELNHLSIEDVSREGLMLNGAITNDAGPIWAEGVNEVFPGWSKNIPTFSQAFGHSSPFLYDKVQWRPSVNQNFKTLSKVLPHKRTVLTQVNGQYFFALDPGFGRQIPKINIQPYMEFHGEKLNV